MNHVVIKDNFLDNKLALKLRELALSMNFSTSPEGIYSGRRTEDIKFSHKFLYDNICRKILKLYNEDPKDYIATMYFHITEGKFGQNGWVHSDSPSILAAIIYLNPQIKNIESGTSLFNTVDNPVQVDGSVLRKSFIEGKDYVDEKAKYNSNFVKTVSIGGIFNRIAAYPGDMLHAGEGYFGNDAGDSRLTLLTTFYKK